MTNNSIIEVATQVNSPDSVYFIVDAGTDLTQLLDGVYPYNGGEDQWVIVIDCQPIGWSQDWGAAVVQEIETLRVRREHAARNPDETPFDGYVPEDDEGMMFASSAELYGLNETTL